MVDLFQNPLDAPPLIPAPDDPGGREAWREGLRRWREAARKAIDYHGDAYSNPAFQWMQNCRACAKVMLFDREFADGEKPGVFKVEDWVANARKRFGEVDALVLWQAYPRIGIDSRNQFDHYREVPGGMKALEDITSRLRRLNIKPILAYNPWDTGTRREPKPDYAVIADMVGEAGFDGVFLDTLNQAGRDLRTSLDRSRPGVALISELALPLEAIEEHHASWAQWFNDSHAPGILRNRWFERRHMLHQVRRWDTDHTGELHIAWMNGAGMFLWENIFGSWNGWTDRDLWILRTMLPIQKHFSDLFTFGEWTPLVDCTLPNVFATKWEQPGLTLWTMVNRTNSDVRGSALAESSHSGARMFDLLRGIEIDHAEVMLPARGIGAVARVASSRMDKHFENLLEAQAKRFAERQLYATRIDPMPVPMRVVVPKTEVGSDMARVKGGPRTLVSKMRVRECGDYVSMPQDIYPGLHGHRIVSRTVELTSFALDRHEVTNAEFLAFVKATRYRPDNTESYLKHWVNGAPRAEDVSKPVVFVDMDDARAYAHWKKKRLPTEDEWQAAVEDHHLEIGKVWNWTESLYNDGHTIYSMIKGGCAFESKGSDWYADTGPRGPEWTAKFIHFHPGLTRSETIGFRCAA